MDKLKNTFKEVLSTVIPMSILILVISYFFAPLDANMKVSFFGGTAMMILGLTLFLFGADISMMEVGKLSGSFLMQKRSLAWMIGLGFLIGFVVTIAEPSLQVLASQVQLVSGGDVGRVMLMCLVGVGVGICLVIALMRVVFHLKMYYVFLVGYIVVFAIAMFTNPGYLAVAFDSGGVTTGPLTVPFILAFGQGLAGTIRSSQDGNDSFGMVGICSIGPVVAVLLLGVLFR